MLKLADVFGCAPRTDLCRGEKKYCEDDCSHAREFLCRWPLVKHEDAEQHRDNRVHICVRGDLADGDMFEKIDVPAIAQQRAASDEIGLGPKRCGVQVEPRPLAKKRAQDGAASSGSKHLPGSSHKAVDAEARAAGNDAANTPTKRTGQQRDYGPKAGAVAGQAVTKRRPQESDESSEAEGHTKPSTDGERLATGEEHLNERDVERDDRVEQRSEAAGDRMLRVDETDIARAEEQEADEGEKEHVFGRPNQAKAAPAAPGQKNCASDKESRSGEQQRRHLRDADTNGGVSGTPEDVHAGKGEHDPGSGCGRMFPGARMK